LFVIHEPVGLHQSWEMFDHLTSGICDIHVLKLRLFDCCVILDGVPLSLWLFLVVGYFFGLSSCSLVAVISAYHVVAYAAGMYRYFDSKIIS
jgi:hypothetical protein